MVVCFQGGDPRGSRVKHPSVLRFPQRRPVGREGQKEMVNRADSPIHHLPFNNHLSCYFRLRQA